MMSQHAHVLDAHVPKKCDPEIGPDGPGPSSPEKTKHKNGHRLALPGMIEA